MAQYATPQNVLARYEGTADPARVQVHLDDAERRLLRRRDMADLPARIAAGTVDVEDVEYVLASAVIRYLRNPEGYTYETAGDRSVNRGSTGSAATAGRITFLPDELAGLAAEPARAPGWGTVRTPRLHDVPARAWDGR